MVITNGIDLSSGREHGLKTGKINSYPEFVDAVKRQIAYMTDRLTGYIVQIEKHYGEINPDPLLSCQYDESIAKGVDVYEGGAKYNSSSFYFYCIASLTDSMAAVKELVFEKQLLSFDELCTALRNNWKGYERIQAAARALPEKYGNNNETADRISAEMADYAASLVNNRPNGRGGVFKAALFSIDSFVYYGRKTMATPDGRSAGEPLSKNLCASVGMDRRGITALINSVTKLDLSKFPTGSVLDIVVHPSAVAGEDGLEAFLGLLKTYFRLGGFAMHGNVFNSETLRDAQKHPEKYRNLQVRVCGWNVFFVNLSKTEQDVFIKQAELAV